MYNIGNRHLGHPGGGEGPLGYVTLMRLKLHQVCIGRSGEPNAIVIAAAAAVASMVVY